MGFSVRINASQRASYEEESTLFWQQLLQTNETFELSGLIYENDQQLPGTYPREEAELYHPVTFISPIPANRGAINLDLLSRVGTKELFAEALTRKDTVASFPVLLVQDDVEHSFSTILYSPVGDSENFVSVVVRVQSLLQRTVEKAESGSKFYLYDMSVGNGLTTASFLGGVTVEGSDLLALPPIPASLASENHYVEHYFQVAQRQYMFIAVAAQRIHTPESIQSALFVGLIILFSLLSGGLVVLVSTSRIRGAEAEAKATLIQRKAEKEAAKIQQATKLKEAKLEERIQAEKGMTEFLAHEMRNPLSVAVAALEFLLAEVSEEIAKDLERVYTSLVYINELLDNILDVSKFGQKDSQTLQLNLEPLSVKKHVLQPIIKMLNLRSSVGLTYVCEQDLWVKVDALRLKQILVNLAKNALKFVDTGFVRIVVLRDPQKKDVIQFAVEDSGPGIAKEDCERLFSKYETLTKIQQQGSRIGLFLCQVLVQAMKGAIFIDPFYNSGEPECPGSRFVVELPLPEIKPVVSVDVESPTHALNFSCKSVLIVDDGDMIRLMTKRLMEKNWQQWAISEATSGSEALELVHKQEFDLIFMDHYMPGVPGWTGQRTITELRNFGCQAVIVGMSANDKEKEHVAAGANGFLQKPVSINKLEKLLRSLNH